METGIMIQFIQWGIKHNENQSSREVETKLAHLPTQGVTELRSEIKKWLLGSPKRHHSGLRRWRMRLQRGRPGFDPWVGKIRWSSTSTPVFLPGESRGQRSLVSHSLWGHKELDTPWWLRTAQRSLEFRTLRTQRPVSWAHTASLRPTHEAATVEQLPSPLCLRPLVNAALGVSNSRDCSEN